MKTQMGEYIVGAYLKSCLGCDFVDYNVRPPAGGLAGLGELDVVGLSFSQRTAYLCEVSTHLGGLEYGKGYKDSVDRIRKKHRRQRAYAVRYLKNFKNHRFMLWSPVVPRGLVKPLGSIAGLEVVINAGYTERVRELEAAARETKRDTGNPFFRALQILAHLREHPAQATKEGA